ncbi:MAG: sporulation transcription factor Spo0A [Corallococcus sp.]|nr:sporulation transcription factor Spo0A [Corallococcus sp.]
MIKIGLVCQDELVEMLSGNPDYEIVFRCQGKDARANIEEKQADVVITDVVMSGEDGFALIEKYRNVKFIVASELKSEVFIVKALECGAPYYLIKPIEYKLLEQRINQLASGAGRTGGKIIRQKSVSEKTLDERISNIFVSVGIPAHIKGYQFLREGIKLAVDNPPIINAITKSLYPTIAQKFDTTPSKVERAIRHAIEVAWNRGKIENINSLFGVKVYSSADKPTNGEFIALLADKMLLECTY